MHAAGIGALVALKNAKIPKYNEEEGKVLFGEHTDKNLPLSEDIPISITYHKIGDNFIVDPTREEEDVSETRLTIGSMDGIISSMQKGETKVLSVEELNTILDKVHNSWKNVFSKIEKHLK